MQRLCKQFNAADTALAPSAANTKKQLLLLSLLVLVAMIVSLAVHTAKSAEMQFPVFSMPDFSVQSIAPDKLDGYNVHLFDVIVKDPAAARALGYGRVRAWFDPAHQAVRQVEFFDLNRKPVMKIHIDEFNVDGDELRIRHTEVIDHRAGTKTALNEHDLRPSATMRRSLLKFYFGS